MMGYGRENEHVIIRTDYSELAAQLAENVEQIGGSAFSIWKSPEQPSTLEIAPGPTTDFVGDYYKLFDQLMNENPGYVQKRSLGKDQSGTYDIMEYSFVPENYEKTILLSSLTHGPEREGFRGLLRLMQHICRDYKQYPQLAYLRKKVRIITVPVVNPYGFSTSSRYNSRGVDLNRNADYYWYNGGANFGTGPVTEVETVIYQNWVDTYPEATLLIDFHNTEPRPGSKQYYSSIPAYTNVERNLFNRIIKTIEPVPSEPLIHQFWEPTLAGYASKKNIHALTVEWVPGAFHTEFTKEDVKDMMEFFVNSVVQLSRLDKPSYAMANSPLVKYIHGGWTDKSTTSTAWAEMDFMRVEIEPQFDGIVEVYGNIGFTNATAGSLNGFSLVFEQFGNRQIEQFNAAGQEILTQTYRDGGTNLTMSLVGAARFIKKDYNDVAGSLFVKFFWKTSGGTLSMRRCNFVVKLTPSDNVERYELYSSEHPQTGVVSPTPQKLYPNY